MWEEDGFDGLATSFRHEFNHATLQDPFLAQWWAQASRYRRSGVDRLMIPAPWTRTIEELCADGVRGECYAHELIRVRPGEARPFLERVRDGGAPLAERHGWVLAGAWTTAMADEDECVVLWAVPTWTAWAAYEQAHTTDDDVRKWLSDLRDVVTSWQRILLVDAPLSPMRTGRQPSRDDRTDWTD